MFYSETLLSKTGPLARVWLAANLERKLTKSNVLDSNIENHVTAIVDQGTAPLALRLSGQLLLGVVRIYSRKARYLLDDCNEAIFKIKMAFRPGNVDLPPESHKANATSLILPDAITELDLLAPMPEPSFLFSALGEPHSGRDPTLLDFGSSQRLSSSIERARRASTEPSGLLEDLDLGLDLGDGFDTRFSRERSIEVGRDAPPHRTMEEEMADTSALYNGPDLDLDFGESEIAPQRHHSLLPSILEEDAPMGGMEDDLAAPQMGEDDQTASAQLARNQRQPGLPLSEIRPSAEQDLDRSFQPPRGSSEFDQDEATIHHAQRAKRRKVLRADTETEMHSNQIRAMQNDRSKILKPAQFLPRDPVLLALMEMQRNGSFVSSILGDGRQRGLAPELRGILSLEVVRRSADLKRKREAGIAPTSPEADLRIEIPADEDELNRPGAGFDFGNDTTIGGAPAVEDDGMGAPAEDDELFQSAHQARAGTQEFAPLDLPEDDPTVYGNNFDETEAPILHPADSGPVSVGTKHAVQLLREHFGSDAASTSTPNKRTKASVLFQDILPEKTTSRADATKMFFEVLVLATKDAVKVEQESEQLGGPLRLRGKRGLWGAWADQTGASSQAVAQTEEVAA